MQIPILMGVDGEARAIVEDFNAGLFYEPENQKDFLEKVATLLNDDGKIQECKLGGEKLARDFDRKKLAKKMLQILKINN